MEENKRRKLRLEKRKKKNRKVVTVLKSGIFLILVFVLTYVGYGMYKEGRIPMLASDENLANLVKVERMGAEQSIDTTSKNNVKKPIVPVVDKYKGYAVDSRLEIPKIELNTNVLAEYTTEGLDICASKYYGPDANEVGNYCVAGHNYNKENMFNHLIDLEMGDSIFLTDNKNGIVEYTIYDIYKVKPQNIKPLSQETEGKRELTLITCVNYSRNRLVIKAVEKIFE